MKKAPDPRERSHDFRLACGFQVVRLTPVRTENSARMLSNPAHFVPGVRQRVHRYNRLSGAIQRVHEIVALVVQLVFTGSQLQVVDCLSPKYVDDRD